MVISSRLILLTLFLVLLLLSTSCIRHSNPANHSQELLTQVSFSTSEVHLAQAPTLLAQAQPLDSGLHNVSFAPFFPSPSNGLSYTDHLSKSQTTSLFSSAKRVSPSPNQCHSVIHSTSDYHSQGSPDSCSISVFIFGICLVIFGVLVLFGILFPSLQGTSNLIVWLLLILLGVAISFIGYILMAR